MQSRAPHAVHTDLIHAARARVRDAQAAIETAAAAVVAAHYDREGQTGSSVAAAPPGYLPATQAPSAS